MNNSLHLWSEEISFVEEWITIDSYSSIEWKCTTQRVESRPVHSIFTPKEVITDVTTQGLTSVTNRVKIHSIFREYVKKYMNVYKHITEILTLAYNLAYLQVKKKKKESLYPFKCNNVPLNKYNQHSSSCYMYLPLPFMPLPINLCT